MRSGWSRLSARTPRWLWLLVACGYMALIWWLSSRARPQLPPAWRIPHGDKLIHAVEFGGLAALWCQVLWCSGGGWSNRRRALAAALLAGAYGVVDELHQSRVPTRTADPGDAVADIVGALLVAATWWRLFPQPFRDGVEAQGEGPVRAGHDPQERRSNFHTN